MRSETGSAEWRSNLGDGKVKGDEVCDHKPRPWCRERRDRTGENEKRSGSELVEKGLGWW